MTVDVSSSRAPLVLREAAFALEHQAGAFRAQFAVTHVAPDLVERAEELRTAAVALRAIADAAPDARGGIALEDSAPTIVAMLARSADWYLDPSSWNRRADGAMRERCAATLRQAHGMLMPSAERAVRDGAERKRPSAPPSLP